MRADRVAMARLGRAGDDRPAQRRARRAPDAAADARFAGSAGCEVSRMCRGIDWLHVGQQKHLRNMQEYRGSAGCNKRPWQVAALARIDMRRPEPHDDRAAHTSVISAKPTRDAVSYYAPHRLATRRAAMAGALAATATRLDPRKFQRSARHRGRRAAGAGRAQIARHAVVQHRNAVQPDLPALLHRIVAEERSPGLSERRRSRRIPRRDRSAAARHKADRLHRRRAVHEPGAAGDARRSRWRAASARWC